MPDITMCASIRCHRSTECYRHQDSGTKPNEYRQAYWLGHEPDDAGKCDRYAPAKRPACPPCNNNCDQGRNCSARKN